MKAKQCMEGNGDMKENELQIKIIEAMIHSS